ncbi:MAG: lipid-A-disaccharide synthase [Thermoanaerobaculia bacterium]
MKLAVVAGEASGDLHAADVLHELKKLDPSLEAFGIGGDSMVREGFVALHHAREMGIVGLFNVIRHLRMFRRIFDELMARIEAERPNAVLLVDYPEFNLRVARKAKELGIPVIYYVSPQIWAWRKGRVKQIARNVDEMIVILPFEEEFYRAHGVTVTYVGHPLVEQLSATRRPPRQDGVLRIALLPGSRRMEVDSLLPPMLRAVEILRRERKVDAYVMQAPTIDDAHLRRIMEREGVEVRVVRHDRGQGLSSADVALSSSGTATLEAAILGTPVVVMYRLSPLTHLVAKRLVTLPYFSLVNIIAGKNVVPELLQSAVTPERIADEVRKLADPANYERVTAELARIRMKRGEPGASRRAAEAIMARTSR